MKYRIEAVCGCRKGKIRRNNEDNFYFNNIFKELEQLDLSDILHCKKKVQDYFCLGVFDGMGGEAYGEIASFIAVNILKHEINNEDNYTYKQVAEFIKSLYFQMNEGICSETIKRNCERMGSTAVMSLFFKDNVYVSNIGDSRCYLLRENQISKITEDHTNEEFCKKNNIKYISTCLTQHLGIFKEELQIEPHIQKFDLQKGDIFLMCSDGITDYLDENELKDILFQNRSIKKAVKIIIEEVYQCGAKDNLTIIIYRIY